MSLQYYFVFLIALLITEGSYADASNQPDQIDISYFEEDVCWSSELDGCKVIGINFDYRHNRQDYYLLGTLGHFFSKHKRDPRGDPLLNSTTLALGIGKVFQWQHDLDFAIEAFIKLQADDDFGNSNSNSGPEIRFRLDRGFANDWRVGADITIQRFQNCSHPDCHQLGASKPVMRNTLGGFFISRRFSSRWALSYRIFDVISYPNDDVYNGRDTDSPGQMLTLNLFIQ